MSQGSDQDYTIELETRLLEQSISRQQIAMEVKERNLNLAIVVGKLIQDGFIQISKTNEDSKTFVSNLFESLS
jgi:hypothetical protein